MDPAQINKIVSALEKIASAPSAVYTITGAADWPLLVVLGGAVVALICFMWADLRSTMKENRTDAKTDIDTLWKAMRECQDDCCPRRK